MSLRKTNGTLESARVTPSRECIAAGVAPGLQTLCNHTGRSNVAGDEGGAGADEEAACARFCGRGSPDGKGPGSDAYRSSGVADLPLDPIERHHVVRALLAAASRPPVRTGLSEDELLVGYECQVARGDVA